ALLRLRGRLLRLLLHLVEKAHVSLLLSAEDVAEEAAAALLAAAVRRLEHPLGGALERQRLEGDVAGAGHVHEEEALASEEALLDPALELDLVLDGRLDHDHAAGVDDERLPVCEVEVQEVAAAVQPHGALAPQALEEEALAAAADSHSEPLGERALDRDLAEVREVGVLLADDLAVELVLADRAGEGAADPDGARAPRGVTSEEHALPSQNRALEAADEAAGHLDVHRDVARDEHHRTRL